MSVAPRSTRPLGVRELAGWRLKIYGVAAAGVLPRAALVDAAVDRASRVLPKAEPGCGFVIAHDARPGCFVLIDWWRGVDLHQRYFQSPLDAPAALVGRAEPHAVGCVWELAVIAHEAAAWAQHAEDPDAYLAEVFSAA